MINKIALFSVPRSGSSWLGELLNSTPELIYRFQPNFAYSFNNKLSETSKNDDIQQFFDNLLESEDAFVNGNLSIGGKKKLYNFDKTNPTHICFKETHYLNIVENLLEESDTKVIGLIRSPFSVINSWLKIPKEFNPNWEIKTEWKTGYSKNNNLNSHFFGYNKWKEATFLFQSLQLKFPNRFYLLNYDALLSNTEQEIKRVFQFCDLKYTHQTRDFIEQSTSKTSDDAYTVFRQKKNDLGWMGQLPSYIEEEIKEDKEFQKLNRYYKWI